MTQVFFAPLNDPPTLADQVAAMQRLIARADLPRLIEPRDFVAVKLHVGERHNTTHVKPELIRALVDAAHRRSENVFLTETSTLYKGERENAVKHLLHAQAHGFGIERVGAPFIMADGLTGGNEAEIRIDGELETAVKIAREIAYSDVLLAVSHPTGHMNAGLGACLKNLGMGLASRAGKLRQHSSILPEVKADKCRYCRKCLHWCPAGAIAEKGEKAFIVAEKCIGCGECLAVCRYDAVKHNWGVGSLQMQKSMAEHAYGAVKGRKCYFFNVLVDMTADCDCLDEEQAKLLPDLGILGSADPVAIDRATLDLTEKANGRSLARLAHENLDPLVQLEHAAKLGMGSMEYELTEV